MGLFLPSESRCGASSARRVCLGTCKVAIKPARAAVRPAPPPPLPPPLSRTPPPALPAFSRSQRAWLSRAAPLAARARAKPPAAPRALAPGPRVSHPGLATPPHAPSAGGARAQEPELLPEHLASAALSPPAHRRGRAQGCCNRHQV